jgi:hypothetical protein
MVFRFSVKYGQNDRTGTMQRMISVRQSMNRHSAGMDDRIRYDLLPARAGHSKSRIKR